MNKIVYKFLFSLIYSVGYFFIAILSTGGGHGNFYLLVLLLPLPLVFVPVFLFGKLDDFLKIVIFIFTMATHYALTIVILVDYNFLHDKGWTQNNFPYTAVIWYLAGQLFIWTEFFNEIFIKNQEIK